MSRATLSHTHPLSRCAETVLRASFLRKLEAKSGSCKAKLSTSSEKKERRQDGFVEPEGPSGLGGRGHHQQGRQSGGRREEREALVYLASYTDRLALFSRMMTSRSRPRWATSRRSCTGAILAPWATMPRRRPRDRRWWTGGGGRPRRRGGES